MIMISLSPKALQAGFARWIQAVVEVANGEVAAIEGKTIRRSFERAEVWGRSIGSVPGPSARG
jgi:hypothetical protein